MESIASLYIVRLLRVRRWCQNISPSIGQTARHVKGIIAYPRGTISNEDEKIINPAMQELLELIEGVIEGAGYKGDRRLMSHALFSALNGIMTTYAQNPGMSLEEIRHYTKILASFIADFFEMGAKRGYY